MTYFFQCIGFIIILSVSLYSIPPEKYSEFTGNIKRFFRDQQYELVEDYYSQYFELFEAQEDLISLGLLIAKYIPDMESKKKLFKKLVEKVGEESIYKKNIYFEYGQFSYILKDWETAIRYLSVTEILESDYYLAMSYYYMKQYDNAMEIALRAEEKLKDKKEYSQEIKLLLIRIYMVQKKYSTAYNSLIKLSNSPEKYIYLHYLFKQTKEVDKQKDILKKLLSKYSKIEKVKSYIKNH